MRGLARVGRDYAGGIQLGGRQHSVLINDIFAVVIGDLVASHGKKPHSPVPSMVTGNGQVIIENTPSCRVGDIASCGHPTTGSHDTFSD